MPEPAVSPEELQRAEALEQAIRARLTESRPEAVVLATVGARAVEQLTRLAGAVELLCEVEALGQREGKETR